MSIVLCDQAKTGPLCHVIWVVSDELFGVRLVEPKDPKRMLQGVAEQKHLHLQQTKKIFRDSYPLLSGYFANIYNGMIGLKNILD